MKESLTTTDVCNKFLNPITSEKGQSIASTYKTKLS